MDNYGSVNVAVVSWDGLGVTVLQPKPHLPTRVIRPRRHSRSEAALVVVRWRRMVVFPCGCNYLADLSKFSATTGT